MTWFSTTNPARFSNSPNRAKQPIGYEDSYAFVRDDAVVFDMRPANVFTTHEGIVIPVDCIPVKLPTGKREFFDRG